MLSRDLLIPLVLILAAAPAPTAPPQSAGFAQSLAAAQRALEADQPEVARRHLVRALERDSKSVAAWELRARLAQASEPMGDRDEQIYALHRALELSIAQGASRSDAQRRREAVAALDPVAERLFGMRARFIAELEPLAAEYEQSDRPHSAIRVHREILALAPEHTASQQAIERISSRPDPTLAEHAQPVDLLADVSEEWILEFDADHATWKDRAKQEGENYTVYTDAGYEVLVRTSAAMEQMSAFYRQFFQYAEDGGKVPRIDIKIFKDHDEYLAKGSSPKEWSGGQFTGGSVETHAGGGIAGLTNTLFHEAAHQFVSLATNAAGWLNEGLASFFEGCRLQANGTVLMNLPATHRLFPLAERLEAGWMTEHTDEIDPENPGQTPTRAPTLRIVLENRYEWGPPWYAPTWGVVYFLYNFQDPVDGRFVYRQAFREFVDKSGGRIGEGAVENFEEVVLGNPSKPFPGVPREDDPLEGLPRTVEELDSVWKQWLLELRDRQIGRLEGSLPYLDWARYAVAGGDVAAAMDHFEKGLIESPDDLELLTGFADLLIAEDEDDRATKLLLQAARVLESGGDVDTARLAAIEEALARVDPGRKTVKRVREALWKEARAVVDGYAAADSPMMVMHVSRRMSTELGVPGLIEAYAAALQGSGKSLDLWQLAYDEQDLEDWDASEQGVFAAAGPVIESRFGDYSSNAYDFRVLSLDRVTSGDYSLQADLRADKGRLGFAGLAFGRKSPQSFHALVLFPPKPDGEVRAGLSNDGWVDLASFYGGNSSKTWRHGPIPKPRRPDGDDQAPEADGGEERAADDEGPRSSTGSWHTLRIDVVGNVVDAWVDGELVTTQRFDSREVLAGGFGLLTGPGAAEFKEVRFLSRPAGDPTSKVQRALRLEQLGAEETPIAESYLGVVPPWPRVGRWVQGEREGWKDHGPAPQLLVLWSIQQNDLVPIDRWLGVLADRHARVGLEILSICSPNDDEAVEAYLEQHPFPGAVGVDHREGVGFGDTNEAFATPRFNLPRVILLDVDQTVVWEGDPGFSAQSPYRPGDGSLLDTPLDQLIATRRLEELGSWTSRWEQARPAVSAGDLAAAADCLKDSLQFDATVIEPVYEAQQVLTAVESAVGSLDGLAEELEAAGRGPALTTLLAWASLLEVEVPSDAASALRKARSSPSTKDWGRVSTQIKSARRKIERDLAEVEGLAAKLESLSGSFPSELAADLRAAAADGDAERVNDLLDEAGDRPRRWLAARHFAW